MRKYTLGLIAAAATVLVAAEVKAQDIVVAAVGP
jgi:hypothetical protein